MQLTLSRLFFRIISKNREVYALKIITLAIAFACSTLVILFCLNEFGYDRFHDKASSVFRILQRNTSESFSGNRTSNRIPPDVLTALQTLPQDCFMVSRVKVLNEIGIQTNNKNLTDQKIFAVDTTVSNIFSFEILEGSMDTFKSKEKTTLLSASAATLYFGTIEATGKKICISSLGDTIEFLVAAVFKDFPPNSHEKFNMFIRFDTSSIEKLKFDPKDTGVYGRTIHGSLTHHQSVINQRLKKSELIYKLQSLPEIYFGPRVIREDAKHGDEYSIYILICIAALILFLAITNFLNLTTLTLPYRSKELAIKKLTGTNQWNLTFEFGKESFIVVGISFIVGILLLLLTSGWIEPILSINLVSSLMNGDVLLVLIIAGLFLILGITPLFMTFKFTGATPTRLLHTDTITFPHFKRIITFLQLGISIFLIAVSMVIKRQVNYSLLKEPGRNHEQIVYINYPKDLTDEGLRNLRSNWKKNNPNIVDLMATSQLPNHISSKELNSEFYFMSVDPFFQEFFGLEMVQGNWFKANDGDPIIVVNEKGKEILGKNSKNVIGVIKDMSGQFNQPEKPIKINLASYINYNFLCIRILEVDIRRTVRYLSTYFKSGSQHASVTFLNKRFEEWLRYQDRLNSLSEVLAVISGLLSCCAIYGLSVSLIRDKLKQIAVHKMFGATTMQITAMLIKELMRQMFIAILIFGPISYIFIQELLGNFVYHTHFIWLDPVIPIAYCGIVITLLCGFQVLSLNRADLTSSLKG